MALTCRVEEPSTASTADTSLTIGTPSFLNAPPVAYRLPRLVPETPAQAEDEPMPWAISGQPAWHTNDQAPGFWRVTNSPAKAVPNPAEATRQVRDRPSQRWRRSNRSQ